MKTYKLNKESYLNPLYIDNQGTSNIIFYNDNGILYQSNRGWINLPGSSNRVDILELYQLDFVKRLKVNLTRKEHFFIVNSKKDYSTLSDKNITLYIYEPTSGIKINPIGEKVALKTDTESNYGYFVNMNATFERMILNKDKNSDKKFTYEYINQTNEIMEGYYTKTVKTDFGEKVKNIYIFLKENKIDVSSYFLEEILKDKNKITKLVSLLNS